jgi:hypothetical protein
MRRMVAHAALGGALLLIAGCISYEQHTTFAEDGSGRVVVDTWVDYFGEDEEGDETGEEAPATEIGQEMGPAFADVDGVAVEENWTKLEGEGEDRRAHARLALAFEKIENVAGRGIFENQNMSFDKQGKKYVFTHTIRHEAKGESEDSTAESEELARTLFEGYTFTYTLVMPGKIVETNGVPGEDRRTVTWEWPLYDFSQQEEIIMTATSKK